MISYKSPYPNYIHQLFITPSKHLYVLKDKKLKWQDKAMDIKLDKIEEADKEHVLYYIIADHYSSAFYTELRTNKTLLSPIEFLTCAWKKKSDNFFQGIPEQLIVPTTVSKKYPEIKNWLQQLNVGIVSLIVVSMLAFIRSGTGKKRLRESSAFTNS